MMHERAIGEVFNMNGVDVVVVPDVEGVCSCELCMRKVGCWGFGPSESVAGECIGCFRSDGIGVHFERFNDGRHLTRHLNGLKKSPIATDREQ